MKKLFLCAGVISAMFLTSCSKGPSVCGCIDTMLEMGKEMKAAAENGLEGTEEMAAIAEKYEGEQKKCEAMEEGKTAEEVEAMQEEAMKCED